jgi:hypothetical protein
MKRPAYQANGHTGLAGASRPWAAPACSHATTIPTGWSPVDGTQAQAKAMFTVLNRPPRRLEEPSP